MLEIYKFLYVHLRSTLRVCLISNAVFSSFLQRHIYGHQGKNIQIFADDSSLAVNPSYITSWLDLLSRKPRVAPFLPKNDPFIMALKKVFNYVTIFRFSAIWCLPLNALELSINSLMAMVFT